MTPTTRRWLAISLSLVQAAITLSMAVDLVPVGGPAHKLCVVLLGLVAIAGTQLGLTIGVAPALPVPLEQPPAAAPPRQGGYVRPMALLVGALGILAIASVVLALCSCATMARDIATCAAEAPGAAADALLQAADEAIAHEVTPGSVQWANAAARAAGVAASAAGRAVLGCLAQHLLADLEEGLVADLNRAILAPRVCRCGHLHRQPEPRHLEYLRSLARLAPRGAP